MGVDFTAIMDIALTWDELYQLPRLLKRAWKLTPELEMWARQHVREASSWEWKLSPRNSSVAEELFNEGYVALDGPDGFGASVHRQAIEVAHLARWWSFLHENEVQAGLQEAVRLIADVVRATRIIYLPDCFFPASRASDLLFEGTPVDEIRSWLLSNVGPPAADAEALRGMNDEASEDLAYLVEYPGSAG